MKLAKVTSVENTLKYQMGQSSHPGGQSMDFIHSSMNMKQIAGQPMDVSLQDISPIKNGKFTEFGKIESKSGDQEAAKVSPQAKITAILQKKGYMPTESKLPKKVTEQYTGTLNCQTTRREGKGVYTFSNAYFQYEGEYKDGKKEGRGILSMQNGTVIEGTFEGDEFVGDASVTYGNGDSYVGGFAEGERNGYGTFISSMLTYSGEWKSNARHGEGRLEDRIKRLVIEGQFYQNKPHGKCRILKDNGTVVYDGHLHNGIRQGFGSSQLDALIFSGDWLNDLWHGNGKLTVRGLDWNYCGKFREGLRVLKPNKLLFSAFVEQWIDPDNANNDPKKDAKAKKGQPAKGKSPDATPSQQNRKSLVKDTPADMLELQDGSGSPLVRHLEVIPEGELKVHAGSKEGLNLQLRVVYQGPDYPDPNPPPPDPKKKAPKKKGDKEAVEEVEIPMLTPAPVVAEEESGRRFKLQLQAVNEDGTLADMFKVDYRKEIKDLDDLFKDREGIEQKVKDMKGESPRSRRTILAKKATLTMIDENSVNLYTPELAENEKPLIVQTQKGAIEVMNLCYPDNFPGGTYRLTITDLTPKSLAFVENLGTVHLPLTVIGKNEVDAGASKKKPAAAKRK